MARAGLLDNTCKELLSFGAIFAKASIVSASCRLDLVEKVTSAIELQPW